MSRRGNPSSEVYEERDREYYAPRRGGRTAEYDEVDIRERRRGADREPEFLREDYGRSSNAGPLVLRDDKRSTAESRPPRRGDREVVETDEVFVSRAPREPPRDRPRVKPVERDEVAYRREKESSTVAATAGRDYSERDREEIIYRDRETFSPPPQQVAREREEFVYRPRERTPPQIAREREEFVFRPRPKEPSYEREEIIIREGEREKERPREREYRDEEIIVRRGEKERERPRERERDRGFEQEEIIIRDRDREGLRPRARSYERESLSVRDDRTVRSRSRDYREEDIIIRRGEGERPWQRSPPRRSPPRDYREEDITIRRSEREAPRNKSRERGYRDDQLVIRERDKPRERSRGPRDEEDIIIRHDDNDRRHKDEIIIRRNERSPSPEPYVPPPPPPEPEPVRAPPIHQEIITHHRHIDHGKLESSFEETCSSQDTGYERAPAPTPPPPAPAPRPRSPSPKEEFQQIEIRRQ